MTTKRELSRIIRAAELPEYTGLGKSKLYQMIADGEFPKPIALTDSPRKKGARGWLETEIIAWQKKRVDARDTVEA